MDEKPFVRDIFGNKIHEGDWVALKYDPRCVTVAKVIQATPKEISRIEGNKKGPRPAILRLIIDLTLDVMNPMDMFDVAARTAGPGADDKIEKALQAVDKPAGPSLTKPS